MANEVVAILISPKLSYFIPYKEIPIIEREIRKFGSFIRLPMALNI